MTQDIPEDGKYTIRLWDPREWKWKEIEIDDYLPCFLEKDYEEQFPHTAVPLGVTVNQEDGMWAALLEKAFAKMYGSWRALECFNDTAAFIAFTGQFR